MIALNELIKDKEKYIKAYKFLGKKINIKKIIDMELNLRDYQLKFENFHSTNNQQAKDMAKCRKENRDTKSLLKTILKTEKNENHFKKKYYKIKAKISKQLLKFPNLPDKLTNEDAMIQTNSKKTTLNEFVLFLKSITNTTISSKNDNYIKDLKDQILDMNDLDMLIINDNEITLLTTEDNYNEIKEKLINFLKENSKELKLVNTLTISNSSSSEYKSKLNDKETIKISMKKDYFSREFNVKYKDTSLDMTKFVKQINITK